MFDEGGSVNGLYGFFGEAYAGAWDHGVVGHKVVEDGSGSACAGEVDTDEEWGSEDEADIAGADGHGEEGGGA